MKNKFSVFFLAIIMLLGCGIFLRPKKAFAEDMQLDIKSKSAYLMNYDTGTVIYKKDEDKRLPIASMTKIMTLLLCFEHIDSGTLNFDDQVCVSQTAESMGGSQVFLEANANYFVNDLIKSIVVASANDSCVALAEHLCGSESSFVDKMNERAQELGMSNTNFENCTGLPRVNHYSSAKDVAIMFSQLLKHKEYFNYSTIWMDKISHPKERYTEISNTNKLIKFYSGCDSGKTGYTSESGHCLAASAVRNGMRIISVVISSPDSKTRFKEVSSMFNYSFANYDLKKVINCDDKLDLTAKVICGKSDVINLKTDRNFYVFTQKNQKRSFEYDFNIIDAIKAPVVANQVVGQLRIFENGICIDTLNVLAFENVDKLSYLDSLTNCINNWAI